MIAIYSDLKYGVTSYNGGAGYQILRYKDKASVFLQGDDAIQFRNELDAAEDVGPKACTNLLSAYDDVMTVEGQL